MAKSIWGIHEVVRRGRMQRGELWAKHLVNTHRFNVFRSYRSGCYLIGMSLVLFVASFSLHAAQGQAKSSDIESKNPSIYQLANLSLKTVLLDKPTRAKIDRQRADYLNPKVEQPLRQMPSTLESSKNTQMAKKTKKPTLNLPKKLTVSAIIKKPDGSSLVRINGQYNQTQSKHIQLNDKDSGPQGAVFIAFNQTIQVPVGQTLLPRKMDTIDNYKLKQQETLKALPQTEDKAIQRTLKSVQILTQE